MTGQVYQANGVCRGHDGNEEERGPRPWGKSEPTVSEAQKEAGLAVTRGLEGTEGGRYQTQRALSGMVRVLILSSK